ncbi:MAG TPA: hypothetical protein PLJ27_21610 [Polyangiaceae bacterium]|nr:hypothetical protein [Polyangiaceae bacterium]HNZ22859.1 hypothetical protein [Polyangiaceae bacterium]HOD21310.1 hypothetical protein [Polyangiaceae bacterium]HOE48469.1 hypothetical protein [Polyangiaceae bacterium]HOH00518.1 hypothetical protein [Polyangiaceae bacterium]
MSRQILYSRLFFSATMFFGCAPDRDTPVQSLLSSTPAIPHGQAGGEAEEDLPAAASAEDLEQTGNIPVLYALHRHVWIRTRPSTQAPWIGFLGLGSRVVLREPEPVRGVGCDAFYAIEPRGYVCADRRVSLDPTDPAVVAVQHIAPSRDRPWLHDYAESRQAPRYEKLPTVEQQRQREFQFDSHFAMVTALRTGDHVGEIPFLLRDVDVSLSGQAIPSFVDSLPRVHEHVPMVKAGSAMSYSHVFDAEGRAWVVTGDGVFVPRDRLAPYHPSTFQGRNLEENDTLPIGFVKDRTQLIPSSGRRNDRSSWSRLAEACFVRIDGSNRGAKRHELHGNQR